ncbi:hypothetical protein B9Z35_08785 [Limnohabitans sp. Jir61]|nr:hypothetical protein B9Z35_08785 [Limnohabitans sp. Jir61]
MALGKPKAPVQTLENLEMKKTLVAIAALAAATGAMAQSSVELYGIIDMGYNKIVSDGTAKITQTSVGAGANSANGSGNLNGSRIGFRGKEDLGNGLNAGFVIEYGVNLTGIGTANTANDANADALTKESAIGQAGLANVRQGFLSLSKNTLGTVNVGTQYALHDATSGAVAGSSATGGTNNVVGASNLLKYGYTGGQPRLANAIGYVSPTFSGVTLRAIRNEGKAVTGDSTVAGTSKTNSANSLAVDYVNGPLKAGIAQTKYESVGAIAATGGQTMLVDVLGGGNDRVGATALAAGTLMNITNRVAGAQYNAGFANFGVNRGTYETNALASTAKDIKSGQTLYSVAVPVAAGVNVMGGYATGMLSQGGADAYKTSAYDLIVVKELSKRTNVYALYVKTKYTAQATTNSAADAQQYQYGVGVRHSF